VSFTTEHLARLLQLLFFAAFNSSSFTAFEGSFKTSFFFVTFPPISVSAVVSINTVTAESAIVIHSSHFLSPVYAKRKPRFYFLKAKFAFNPFYVTVK